MWRHRALAVIVASLTLFASRAEAQQQVHRIGYLGNIAVPESMHAWLQGLHEQGYVEGQNLQMNIAGFKAGRTSLRSSLN